MEDHLGPIVIDLHLLRPFDVKLCLGLHTVDGELLELGAEAGDTDVPVDGIVAATDAEEETARLIEITREGGATFVGVTLSAGVIIVQRSETGHDVSARDKLVLEDVVTVIKHPGLLLRHPIDRLSVGLAGGHIGRGRTTGTQVGNDVVGVGLHRRLLTTPRKGEGQRPAGDGDPLSFSYGHH